MYKYGQSEYNIQKFKASGNNDSIVKTKIHNLFDSLKLQNTKHYMLVGDLNCRHTVWSNPTNNQKGNKLKEWLTENEINFRCRPYATNFPSFPRTGSCIDICIADCRL